MYNGSDEYRLVCLMMRHQAYITKLYLHFHQNIRFYFKLHHKMKVFTPFSKTFHQELLFIFENYAYSYIFHYKYLITRYWNIEKIIFRIKVDFHKNRIIAFL